MATAGTVFALVRSLLGDGDGTVFTDTVLLAPGNLNYGLLQQALVNLGCSVLQATSSSISVSAGATTVTLPSDLIVPYKMWERAVGDGENDWVPMKYVDQLPVRSQFDTLSHWKFEGGAIVLLGATQDRQVRILYEKTLADFVDATSTLAINQGQYALAYLLCQDMAISRGQLATADRYSKKAEFAINELSTRFTHGSQAVSGRRRLGYGKRAT